MVKYNNIKELKNSIINGNNEVPFKDDDVGIELLELMNLDNKFITLIKKINIKYLFIYIIIYLILVVNGSSELMTIDDKYEKMNAEKTQEISIPCLEKMIVIDDDGMTREYEVMNKRNSILSILTTSVTPLAHKIQLKLFNECTAND